MGEREGRLRGGCEGVFPVLVAQRAEGLDLDDEDALATAAGGVGFPLRQPGDVEPVPGAGREEAARVGGRLLEVGVHVEPRVHDADEGVREADELGGGGEGYVGFVDGDEAVDPRRARRQLVAGAVGTAGVDPGDGGFEAFVDRVTVPEVADGAPWLLGHEEVRRRARLVADGPSVVRGVLDIGRVLQRLTQYFQDVFTVCFLAPLITELGIFVHWVEPSPDPGA